LGNFFISFMCVNILLVSTLFWLLTYIGYIVRDDFENYDIGIFYECGFRSLQKVNIKFNLNTLVLSLFLILYEIEFLFLIPYSFTLDIMCIHTAPLFFIFILFILVTLLFDIYTQTIIWVY